MAVVCLGFAFWDKVTGRACVVAPCRRASRRPCGWPSCRAMPWVAQVQNVDTLAGTAKGIIKSIQARAIMNKCVLGIIVILLLGIDGALLYLYVKKH